jgi:hypothetical protein
LDTDIPSVSRGASLVLVDESTEPVASEDRPDSRRGLTAANRRAQLERAVRPRRGVVRGVLVPDPLEVALAEDQEPVQAFAPNRPDPALGTGPGAGCSDGRPDHAPSPGAEHVVAGAGELGVAIADRHRRTCVGFLASPAEVACPLGEPRGGRVRGAAGDDDPPRIWNVGTDLLRRFLADTCELCGTPEGVQVHHIRALKQLQPRRPGPKPEWVKVMAARHRKTLVVCRACHVGIHDGRLDGN